MLDQINLLDDYLSRQQEIPSRCEMIGHEYGYDQSTNEKVNGYPVYQKVCVYCSEVLKFQSYTTSL